MNDRRLEADLRLAVHRLRRSEPRRVFPPAVHVGDLVGAAASWREEDGGAAGPDTGFDTGLRTDVVAALLDRALDDGHYPPAVWLTRTGGPWPHDVDAAWLPAVRQALAAAGVVPRCLVVVTRTGWYDPVSGARAEWRRLRIRSRRP